MHAQVIAKQLPKSEPERAPGLANPEWRASILRRETLVAGRAATAPIGESLRYLVDVPLTDRGKAPKLKKSEVLLFARTVPGRPGEIQLVGDGAQMLWSQRLEDGFRPVLTDLVSLESPPVVTGIRDALSVPGNLAGESETQLFLETENDGPVSVTVVRRPNMAPVWGVSWTDIVDQSATAPQPETLEWYRLACSLPATLPGEANLARDPAARGQAAEDYRYVVAQLGPCERTLGPEFNPR